jgi:23S rRNA (pseudouridine1915-N3)-methyltransferase
MKLLVVAVGGRMPSWVNAGFEDYARRMPREARVELVEIRAQRRTGRSVEQALRHERDRIRAALPGGCMRVVLDEGGQTLDTRGFARFLSRCLGSGRDVAFVIGGADGLHPDLKREADLLLALSAMTLPHGLARVMLAEQLYRSLALLQGHPYHRE